MSSSTTENISILIGVPTSENILPDTFRSIYGLQLPEGVSCFFDFARGYACDIARNKLVQEAIDYNFDYILMVDSDIILPPDTLLNMLEVPVDICLGIYPRKNTRDEKVEIFKLGFANFVETYCMSELDDLSSIIEVKGGGYGCALIRTDIFGTITYPWFKYVLYQNGDVLSEDNYFSDKAVKSGYKIYCDPRVKCGHSIRGFQWR